MYIGFNGKTVGYIGMTKHTVDGRIPNHQLVSIGIPMKHWFIMGFSWDVKTIYQLVIRISQPPAVWTKKTEALNQIGISSRHHMGGLVQGKTWSGHHSIFPIAFSKDFNHEIWGFFTGQHVKNQSTRMICFFSPIGNLHEIWLIIFQGVNVMSTWKSRSFENKKVFLPKMIYRWAG